ncbi:MAG: D-alanyl-D-alanine carboxypeptidase family protein [Eubacteriales bacterium]|nr:D-alanyl-D-alanine carboxypeptidase family protein [Eubacteriales bacterium]
MKEVNMTVRRILAALAGAGVILAGFLPAWGEEQPGVVQMIPAAVDMQTGKAGEEEPGSLYALSALLMDGETGRVLYEKEGYTRRPNASTTKVLTCILALENASGDDYVQVSKTAASQPEVRLNIREGEQYYLEDLLYSLMLKSHNDSAVAVAEHVAGSVEGFARMMNEKAREIGCTDTHFVTPNGLDAVDGEGVHETTARDLALIMRYAIQNEAFCRITQTRDYSFSDLSGKRQFSLHNANALLDMEEGVISGKTGFTGDAGYCYVCACEREGRLFIIALLGCGWPNNKTYKWKDTRALLAYGEENYEKRPLWQETGEWEIPVREGAGEGSLFVKGLCQVSLGEKERTILLKKDEEISLRAELPKSVQAPVKKGQRLGTLCLLLGEEAMGEYPILADRNIQRITYFWCVDQVFHRFFHG